MSNSRRWDYQTVLRYLEQSRKIRQELGDRSGYCVTLFNMGHIFFQNQQIQEAVQALTQLAGSLGLPDGLQGWERLSQQLGDAP